VYRAFNERSGRRFGQPISENNKSRVAPPGWNLYMPFGLDTPAKVYSLWYQRYMHKYGITNMDFGLYPVVARKHAATNPNAFYYQQPLTLEEHQQSRWIVEPILRKLDCCQESDGGVALVVTSMDRARDLPHEPVRVAAASQGHLRDGDEMFGYYRGDLSGYEEGAFLGKQLYEATGLTPDDIDVAMIYENFTPIVFIQLEAFGFCGPGEATDFIAGGNIEVGGKLPVNPNGGLLGEAYIHGMNNILEGVRQVRGTAANQVADAEHVLVSAGRSGLVLSP
jgi:acetyl-CoA acetyltransferase